MEAVGDVYTIPQENLDFCATIGQIAREQIAPALGRDRRAGRVSVGRPQAARRAGHPRVCPSRPSTAAPAPAR